VADDDCEIAVLLDSALRDGFDGLGAAVAVDRGELLDDAGRQFAGRREVIAPVVALGHGPAPDDRDGCRVTTRRPPVSRNTPPTLGPVRQNKFGR
jgi:hypothetical protein